MASGQRQGLLTRRLGDKISRCAASSGARSLVPPLRVAGTKPPHCCAECLQPGLRGGQQPQGRVTGTRCIAQRQHGAKVPRAACPGALQPPADAPTRNRQGTGASQPRWLRRIQQEQPCRAPWAPELAPGRCLVPEPQRTLLCWPWGAIAPPESLPIPAEPGQPTLGSFGMPVCLLEAAEWGDQTVGCPRSAGQRGAGSARLHGQLGQRAWAGPRCRARVRWGPRAGGA